MKLDIEEPENLQAVIENVWHEFSVPLKNFIRQRVPNEYDAEDIWQEIYCKIHHHIAGLQDQNKLRPWVYRITRNAIADYYRKRQRALELTPLPDEMVNVNESWSDGSANAEIANCLKTMISYLPEKYQQAIYLTAYHNLTQKELGERTGISLTGAKSRVQRARGKLKEMLLGCCDLEFDRTGGIIDYRHKSSTCKFC